MSDANRRRALREVVSLEAWHKSFTASRRSVDLNVDVAFIEGRIAEPEGSGVRIRLGLRRAEVKVIIPEAEPVKVDIQSVSRDATGLKVTETEEVTSATKRSLGGRISGMGGVPSLKLEAGAGISGTRRRSVKSSRTQGSMSVTHYSDERDHNWIISPTTGQLLLGRPWNALEPDSKSRGDGVVAGKATDEQERDSHQEPCV